MPRRAALFVFFGLAIALVLVTGISAGPIRTASSAKKAEIAAAQDRLMEIRLEAGTAEAAYNNALFEMNQLNGQIQGEGSLEVAKDDSPSPEAWNCGLRRSTRVEMSPSWTFWLGWTTSPSSRPGWSCG